MVFLMRELPRFRWAVLSTYILAGISSQLIWITYAPILSVSASFYHVSEKSVGLFAAVFPLIYIVISIPVGYYIDKYGFRKALLVGMTFLGIFSALRGITTSFIAALSFQTLAGIGQPFIMNSISKLVRSWFPEEETALATGLGTLSLMLGILLALSLTPFIVYHVGMKTVLITYGIYSLITLLLVYIIAKEPKESFANEKVSVSLREMIGVLKNRNILILSILFFLGVGSYTAFTTWIEPLVEAPGVPIDKASLVGSFLTLGGIFGSIFIPGIADKMGSRKRPMLYTLFATIFLWIIPYFMHGTFVVSTDLFITGFLFLSLAPLALDLSAISVGLTYSGAANATLWEFSQIGSLILIWIFEILGTAIGWASIYLSMAIIMAVMFLMALIIKEQK